MGKTSLLLTYIYKGFPKDYEPTGKFELSSCLPDLPFVAGFSVLNNLDFLATS